MKRILIYIFIMLGDGSLLAQEDSISVFSHKDFISRVIEHHPLSKQAALQIEYAEAKLLKSKGGFDPTINGSINQKYFKDDQYYDIISAGLKVPTWYGISFQGGYDLTNGSQLNPERLMPDDGLWYAGINVNVGKGLIIDQRRAEYKKARIYVSSSVQEQRLLLNELYLQASLAYWDWFKSYNKMVIYQDAVVNAQDRFLGVRQSTLLGDKPMIDTLEAYIQLQSRMFNYLDAELEYLNNSALLEIYLWENGTIPLELDSNTAPPLMEIVSASEIDPNLLMTLDSIKLNHPELLKSQYSIDQKAVDIKLGRENLKPEINFRYNAITENTSGQVFNNYSINNYTWGAQLKFPIFLRKERGQLKMSKIEMENLEYDLQFKTQQIEYKIDLAINQWSTTFQQIEIWQKTTGHFQTLLESEQTLFTIGESSLFMINSREKAYINARLILIEKQVENKKAEIKTLYAFGILNNEI